MTTETAAATIPDSARTPGDYPRDCREKRWTVSPRQADAGLASLLQPRRPRGVRSLRLGAPDPVCSERPAVETGASLRLDTFTLAPDFAGRLAVGK